MLTFIKSLFRVAEIADLDRTIDDLQQTIAGYRASLADRDETIARLRRENARLIAASNRITTERERA